MDPKYIIEQLLTQEIDFNLAGIKDRIEKDIATIDLFFQAAGQRLMVYMLTILHLSKNGEFPQARQELEMGQFFVRAMGELWNAYIARIKTLAKPQFPKDALPKWLGGSGKYDNPFAAEKNRARALAREWQLDPRLLEILG